MCRSVRQTPHARTRRSTCPGPGSGIGQLAARAASPRASSTIARIPASAAHHSRRPRDEHRASRDRHPGGSRSASSHGRARSIGPSGSTTLYVQRGDAARGEGRRLERSAVGSGGDGEHSVAAPEAPSARGRPRRRDRARRVRRRAARRDRLVVPHVRPGIAQLAFLHVTDGSPGARRRRAARTTSSSGSPRGAATTSEIVVSRDAVARDTVRSTWAAATSRSANRRCRELRRASRSTEGRALCDEAPSRA